SDNRPDSFPWRNIRSNVSSGGLMCNRTVAAAAAAALLSAAPLFAQTSESAAPSSAAAKAAAARASELSRSWTPPKTPWGHPDISGTWTSDGAIGIPLARPAELAGRVELTPDEFAKK